MKKLAIVIWTITSIYCCIGGISNIIITKKFEEAKKLPLFRDTGLRDKDDNFVRNIAELDANKDYESMTRFYPMFTWWGETFSYILILMAFGVLGAVIKILLAISLGKEGLGSQHVYILPVVGALLGLLVLVASDLLPEFKYKSGNDKLYYCLTLLAGLFTQQFLVWLEARFNTLFSNGAATMTVVQQETDKDKRA